MFKGFFEVADKILNFVGSYYDKGYHWHIISVLLVLVVASIGFIAILAIDSNKDTRPHEQRVIEDEANVFCQEKNYNSWEWVNKSSYTFDCVNKTVEEEREIEKYFIG